VDEDGEYTGPVIVTPPPSALIESVFAKYRREWNASRGEDEEYFDEMRARVKREDTEREAKWRKEGYARLAEARKRPGYQSKAARKREAKAKKSAGWHKFGVGPLDPNGKRLEEIYSELELRYNSEKDPA
jgi:hypothetical protein